MALFKNSHDSHEHSLQVLNLLYEYDDFMDSIQVVADMGCGVGLDSRWWAELASRDDSPVPHNYTVYAVDQDIRQLDPDVLEIKNIIPIEGNFEERIIPRQVDLIWAHDCFQYSRDPYKCLATWKSTMNVNGMLVLSVPQTTYFDHNYNHLQVVNHSHQYYSYNVLNLMYMLAISGFDCRDAYFYREEGTPWLYAAVYASEHGPMPGAAWHELAEHNLVNDTVINSVNRYSYARLDELLVTWLDKNNYRITN
jgi:SAM-dependent methyltransferase